MDTEFLLCDVGTTYSVNGRQCYRVYFILFFFSHGATAPNESGLRHFRGFTITFRHTTLGRTPLDEWSARRRPVTDNTQHSQETDIHAPGGIRTHIAPKRAAADPRLRPRGYRCLRVN